MSGMDILDAWSRLLENQTPDNTKVILANAAQHVGQSVQVFSLAAADLEYDIKSKSVLRKCKRLILPSLLLPDHHCSV